MRIVVGLILLVLVGLTTTVQAAEKQERKIAVSDCPKAVQKTLKREARKGKIVDVDVHQDDGVAVYESEVWFGDLEYDVVIREDGRLLAKLFAGEDDDEDSDDDEGEGDDEDSDNDEGDDDDETETPVRMADLPKSVLKTLKREDVGGEVDEIVKKTEDGKTIYEAEVEFGDKDYEIEIAEDGTLLSKTLEDDADEDDADEDDDDEDEDEDD